MKVVLVSLNILDEAWKRARLHLNFHSFHCQPSMVLTFFYFQELISSLQLLLLIFEELTLQTVCYYSKHAYRILTFLIVAIFSLVMLVILLSAKLLQFNQWVTMALQIILSVISTRRSRLCIVRYPSCLTSPRWNVEVSQHMKTTWILL